MRRHKISLAPLLVGLVGGLLGLLAGCFSGPRYRGPRSDHFDGRRFFDQKSRVVTFGDFLRWRLHRHLGPWPRRVSAPPGPPPPRQVPAGEMRVTFVNHATVLVQLDGVNVLTDPIYAERASPLTWTGPRRVRPPGIRWEDLPRIDLVLISHNHYDHLDLSTLRRLWQRDRPVTLVGLGNGPLLRAAGIGAGSPQSVREVDWWQEQSVGALRVTSVPNQHGSARGLCDRDGTLWTAYVVRGPQSGAFYFAGDTGYGPHFAQVGGRFPGLRLALLPIGAYQPRWFMKSNHMDPAQAVQAHRDLGAATSVAIHFGTFPLADDGMDEPGIELDRVTRSDPTLRFWVLGFGEGRDLGP